MSDPETGDSTNGADAGSHGSAATRESGGTLAGTEKAVPQSKVNAIAARARAEGAESKLKEILQQTGFESVEELLERLKLADGVAPRQQDPEKRRAEKIRAEMQAEVSKRDSEIVRLKMEADAARVMAASLQHLSDAIDPEIALLAIQKYTGAHLRVMEDGSVLPVDKDGDPVSRDLAEWFRIVKAKVPWIIKPAGAGAGSGRRITAETDRRAEAEERRRAQSDEYRRRMLAKEIIDSGLIGSRS